MTGRAGADNPLLGMIVDRSSFDAEDREDEISLDDSQMQNAKRRGDGKVRRKLRWKPAAFRSSSNKQKAKYNSASSDVSVLTDRSASARSSASFHTFYSNATPVQSNGIKRKKQPIALSRPNYRDTFDGVSTIDNEGQYVHAKNNTASTNNSSTAAAQSDVAMPPQRSRTLPTTAREFDSSPTPDEGGYSTDISPTIEKAPFDPFGDVSGKKQGGFRKRRPPRSKIVAMRNSQKNSSNNNAPSPGESPLQQQERRSESPAPVTPTAETRIADMSEEDLDASFVLKEDYDIVRQVSSFSSSSKQGLLGISPIKVPNNVSPFVSPTKGGRPPVRPGRTSVQDRVAMFEKFSSARGVASSPPVSPVQKPVAPPPTTKSPVPDMMLLSEARKSLTTQLSSPVAEPRTPSNKDKKKKPSLRLGSPVNSPSKQQLFLDDSENDTPPAVAASPKPPPEQLLSHVVVKRGLLATPMPRDASSVRSSKARREMGPVDVDEGAFVEAERHLKAIHEMAAEHLAHGEYEEALEVFEEILRGQKQRYGSDHYRIGTALHNIGIVHLKSGNYAKAVETCTEAVKVRKEALVPNHPDVAVSLAQLGVAELESKNYRPALVSFREALQIRRDFLGPKHPKVGKILNNVGCALYELGELEGARLAFEEALEIQHETLRTSAMDESDSKNQSNQILLSIAATLCNIGSIKARWSEHEEARLALEEALLIQQSVLGDDHPSVLGTMENIGQLDKSMNKTTDTSASDFFSLFTTAAGSSTSVSTFITDEPPEDDDPTTVEKLVSMVTAFTLSRSRRLYKKVEELVPRENLACGFVQDVTEDDAVSLPFSDSPSVPFSEGSSTISYRQSRNSGFEI